MSQKLSVLVTCADTWGVYYLPLYMTMSFSSLRDDGWGKVPMEEIAF